MDSTDQDPSFTYSTPGTYTVSLTATNAAGSDDEVKTGYITVNVPPVAPTAGFTADVTEGDAPLNVQFTDQSTGDTPLSYAWDFDNDGTVDSTEQDPSFTYSTPGTYTVSLTVTNAAGSDDEVKTDYITVTVPPVPPTADFTADVTEGDAPLVVQFTD
ncbi:MAG: PKD domain-containing protein, partial [Methanomicrobiaceae archaeon]|nr:PKD domain-containing protein [Methanomicrobiaceae archaeon]